MRSRRTLPLALAALSYVIAFAQRPGKVVADTKVHLYLDPGRFLRDVLSLWSTSPDLGHVWASQYGGYAWPMAPWFALGDAIGAPTWIVQRLWLGTILALAAWGVVRMLDALHSERRGVLHAAAAALYVVNPYVTVYANRASVTLLAYAALPWLLLATHKMLREPRGWRWPAIFALVLATAGGGVNAATTAWVVLAPALLFIYELWLGEVRLRVLRPVLARLVPLGLLVNLWWLVPLLLAGRGAPNFLIFTEQPGTIWATTSLPESLRLMGFWTSYVGVGYGGLLRPYQGSAPAMLYFLPIVLAGLALPATALGSFAWTRRGRYVPFFLLLVLLGVLVMVVGWPDGTPLRTVVTGAYYRIESLQPLRTAYKAGALVALGLAVLCGAAVAAAWARWPRALVGGVAVVVVGLAAWPLVTGRAVERQLEFTVPKAYKQVAGDLSARPDSSRAMVLPGQLFASYDWGGTVDSVLPPLARHELTTRWIVPFADLRSTELQFTVDNLITQERLRPGQLRPLLDLMGVGDVVLAADGNRALSGEMPTADALRELNAQLGGAGQGKAYGSNVGVAPAAGEIAPTTSAPQLRRVELPTGGLVRVLPQRGVTVVDGAGGGLAALAAYGALDPARKAYMYAPDVTQAGGGALTSGAGLRQAAAGGAAFVVSDTDRRRAFVAARVKGTVGATLPKDEGVSVDGTILDPFGDLDQRVQTTAELTGVKKVTAPSSPQVTQFPEQRPFAALDGNSETAWIADRALVPSRHTLTVDFDASRDVGTIRLLPYSDSRGVVEAVTVNGRRFAVRRGWNTLAVGLRGVASLEVHLAKVTKPKHAHAGAGGIRELSIPDVVASEKLRPPTDVEDALRGTDLSHNDFTYIFDRTTTDVPERQQKVVGERGAGEQRDAQDPEPVLRRVIHPPAARTYRVDGWGTVPADAPDAVFAQLDDDESGVPADAFSSSSRFEGLGRYRASGAFDGSGGRAWIAPWIPGQPVWRGWTTPRATTVRTLTLAPASVRVRRPTRVRLWADGHHGPELRVGSDGVVALPAAVRGTVFRLDVVDAAWPAGTSKRIQQRRAVGIGELRGTGVTPVAVPRTGRVALPCGIASATIAGRVYNLRATADRATIDAGQPIRLTGCGTVAVPALDTTIEGGDSTLRLDSLRLDSPAPAGAAPVAASGRVTDFGSDDRGGRTGVKVAVSAPSWLMLGESYDKGWKATCDGTALGEPVPIDGYANGWRLSRSCDRLTFAYGPQKLADGAGIVSAAGAAALLALLGLVFWRRRRRRGEDAADAVAPAPGEDAEALAEVPDARPLALPTAVAVALPAAVLVGGLFGLRAGAVAAPLLLLLLWRGVGDRLLAYVTLALLGVVVPVIYILVDAFGDHRGASGGSSTEFPADRLGAHWVAVAAYVLVVVTLVRTLAAARKRDRVASGS